MQNVGEHTASLLWVEGPWIHFQLIHRSSSVINIPEKIALYVGKICLDSPLQGVQPMLGCLQGCGEAETSF